MNDNRYFDNIRRIEEIISQLDSRMLLPEEALNLFETAKNLIKECEVILDSYSGTIDEMNFLNLGHNLLFQ